LGSAAIGVPFGDADEGFQRCLDVAGIGLGADREQTRFVELDPCCDEVVLARKQQHAGVDELTALDIGNDANDCVGEGASWLGHSRPPR
jgi:imidazole glycerol phosphate synthase subunit HisF